MRRILIVVMLISLLLGACGKTLTSTRTKVTFWHGLSGPLGDTLTEMIREFNRSQDEIEVVANPISSYTALSQKLMASIQAKKQPDIAQVFESWTAKYIEADVLCPLDSLFAEDPDFSEEDLLDIYPVFRESNTFNGTMYSFPFNKSVRAYFYNKDEFYRAGLDPDHFPQTWQEFREYNKLLTRDTDGDGKIDRWGTNFNVNEWQFVNLLHQAGGRIIDETGKPILNSAAGVEALNFILDMMFKDKSVYLVREYEGQNDFMAGIVSMYEGSSVSITHMRQQPINFNIGFAPLPTYKTRQSAVSGANIVIFRSGDRKRERAAWEFIKWFTAKEQTAYWSVKTSYMPVRRSAMESDVVKDFLTKYPHYQGIYSQLEEAVYEPQSSAWFKARPELKSFLERAMRGDLTAQETVDGAAAKFAELIAAEME
ncbi:MAG: ABC transporter substrate-binding protein [Candidatus Cloacimonetes bacterium]|jgi:multiple sugar transport system substrate-binding protein|nr:ABC transporter substrate-binding protein [Candidatus Cloacimonadota bacterium]MDY0336781.1 ABC transporter substrate-binding protein [Candidatus Cloacimonadaceae bacterium]MCK9334125.1 ABC transporter substrate-binding protein [Candidatus Cloacimonadota bacterium]MDD2543136.1 ABC transporter substrate-binding protein [Candidatus Cloacimonadota bacterium]MDD2683460.1 ABC transporter substrate-binding protein [Candidatus Cloacimonadota bacterium]